MIRAIVCVDKKWGIGKQGHLLFDLPEDMEFFRRTTTGKVVCMGYNTLMSLPGSKPLPNRTNIVLCHEDITIENAICVHSLDELFSKLKYFAKEDIYVIGGAMFYKTMLPYCEEILVTKVMADGEAELFFPDLNESSNFVLMQNYGIKRSTAGLLFCIVKYKKY